MEQPQRQSILENPDLDEAFKVIKSGISRRRTIVIAGSCVVDYEGRASSTLGLGERIVLIKPDGSALVHRPRDYDPVNWQPPGSLFRTRLMKKGLVVRVFRRKEKEILVITFTKLNLVAVLDMVDAGEFSLYGTENDMQEAILFRPSLLEEGFRPISYEHGVEPGFVDILGYDKDMTLTVVEIKRNRANKDAVLQLKKYMDVISTEGHREVRAILVAPELGKGVQELLAILGYEFKLISPQKCYEVLKQKKGKPLTDYFT